MLFSVIVKLSVRSFDKPSIYSHELFVTLILNFSADFWFFKEFVFLFLIQIIPLCRLVVPSSKFMFVIISSRFLCVVFVKMLNAE